MTEIQKRRHGMKPPHRCVCGGEYSVDTTDRDMTMCCDCAGMVSGKTLAQAAPGVPLMPSMSWSPPLQPEPQHSLPHMPCCGCGTTTDPTPYGTTDAAVPQGQVCAKCWEGKTRLERMMLKWEPDVYVQHRPRPEPIRNLRLPEYTSCIFSGSECDEAVRRRMWPDRYADPRRVDDPSGDDIAADYDWRRR